MDNQLYTAAFFIGTATETLATYPLDFRKTILQLNRSGNSLTFSNLRNGYKTFYQGCTTALVGNVIRSGYRLAMLDLSFRYVLSDRENATLLQHVLCGSAIGFSETFLLTTPFERLKILQMQSNRQGMASNYPTIIKGFRNLYSNNGIISTHRGLIVVTFQKFIASASRFSAFSTFYQMYTQLRQHHGRLSFIESYSLSAVSGIVAVIITQPFDYVKTNIQASNDFQLTYSKILKRCIKQGWSNLSRGCGLRLVRMTFGTSLLFSIFEQHYN